LSRLDFLQYYSRYAYTPIFHAEMRFKLSTV